MPSIHISLRVKQFLFLYMSCLGKIRTESFLGKEHMKFYHGAL